MVSLFRSTQHHKKGYVLGDSLLSVSCAKSKHWAILNMSSEKALSFFVCVTCFSPLLNQGQRYQHILPGGILVEVACFEFQGVFNHKTNVFSPCRDRYVIISFLKNQTPLFKLWECSHRSLLLGEKSYYTLKKYLASSENCLCNYNKSTRLYSSL